MRHRAKHMYLTLLMPTTTIERDPHVTLAYPSKLVARAFYTSGSKKVVCSCLQDLDLLFEWHMNFSALFIRTRQFLDAVKELSWMSARTDNLVKTNRCSKIFILITKIVRLCQQTSKLHW